MAAMWSVIAYTGLTAGAFYFILLRPVLQDQRSRRKAQRQLQIGDEVVTTGGLIAEVVDVVQPADGPTEIILELGPGFRVRALTEAIARRLTTLEGEPEPSSGQRTVAVEEAVEQRA